MFQDGTHFVEGFRDLCCETARELLRSGSSQRYFSLVSIVRKFEQYAAEKKQEEIQDNYLRDLPRSSWQITFARISEIREFWLDKQPAVVVSETGIPRKELVSV